jgi:hypothetical protein
MEGFGEEGSDNRRMLGSISGQRAVGNVCRFLSFGGVACTRSAMNEGHGTSTGSATDHGHPIDEGYESFWMQ